MYQKKQNILFRILEIALGAIFIFASWHKITNPAQFAKIIYGYGLFPLSWINILAIWIPFMELASGACLISGFLKRPALFIYNVMVTVFIIIIAINLVRGHQFDCGCFSFAHNSSTQAAITLLIRDILILITGLSLYFKLLANQNPGN